MQLYLQVSLQIILMTVLSFFGTKFQNIALLMWFIIAAYVRCQTWHQAAHVTWTTNHKNSMFRELFMRILENPKDLRNTGWSLLWLIYRDRGGTERAKHLSPQILEVCGGAATQISCIFIRALFLYLHLGIC